VGLRTGPDDVEKRKILPLPGLELRPLVASRYTDCAIPASNYPQNVFKSLNIYALCFLIKILNEM
jgi:hypothetical protein